MNDYETEKIAIFRYGVLSSYISTNGDNYSKPADFFREAADKKYRHPLTDKELEISEYTIYRWYKAYKENGFDGLKPKRRSDNGRPRKLDDDIKEKINYYRSNYQRIPSTVIYTKLIDDGVITKKDISLSTITRYSNYLKAQLKQSNKKDYRRYEREHINEVWCGDTCYGPHITVDGIKKRVYFIGLIDDASRMITGIGVFYSDSFNSLLTVLKKAISTYGKPAMLNFDNGGSYHNHQMEMLAARIGTYVNYNPPYTPQSKSKIERFWRTFRDHYLSALRAQDYHDLCALNKSLQEYVYKYNNTVHNSLNGQTPHDRFFKENNLIHYLDEEKINKDFMFEDIRKVSIDNVIVIDNIQYEVPYRYGNQKVKVRYIPNTKEVYIEDSLTKELVPIHLLNKNDNSHIRREKLRISGGE